MSLYSAWPKRSLAVGVSLLGLALASLPGTAVAASTVTPPFTECPAIGSAQSCQILLVVNPDKSISVLGDPSVGPYDGSDDTLVGIINQSSTAISAITVSGQGSGLAGFDGDGICTYSSASGNGSGFDGDSYCTSAQASGTDPADYEGPGTSFTVDPNSQDDVEVDFSGNGLSAGSSTYFSLEGILTAAAVKAQNGGLPGRYVALGDSVPYGHGLVNPYPAAQAGLPASALQQGPSDKAYPALVAAKWHLSLSSRSSNCTLTGDDLAISGASAAQADVQHGSDQCTSWPDSQSVQRDELPAAQLAQDPAKLVTIQAGADDIHFGDCMAWELTKFGPFHAQGTRCVTGGSVTSNVQSELSNVRSSLKNEIEQAAQNAQHVAVLNYYQAIPSPSDFKKTSIFSGGEVDPICWGLSHNLKGAYYDAIIIQSELNVAVDAAVSDAHKAGFKNVKLVDLTNLEAHHEMCTGKPALFSGVLMSKSAFYDDLKVLARCHAPFTPKSCRTTEPAAAADIQRSTWRAAHPNAFGQKDIARKVEAALGNI